MRKALGFILVVGAAGLALTPAAIGTYVSPKLAVSTVLESAVTIEASQAAADDPTAKITIYAPLGTTTNLAQPSGATLGTLSAKAAAADLGGAIVPLQGTVQNVNPGDYQAPPANLCSPGLHQAVWLLNLTAAGQSLKIPVYVDPTPAPASAFSSYQLQVCLAPPDIPTGNPLRAPLGAKLVDAMFTVKNVFTPAASGQGRWRALYTPFTPGIGQPNASGTLEVQSILTTPAGVALTGRQRGKTKRVAIVGAVSLGGQPAAGAAVTINAGLRGVGKATTDSSGKFATTVTLTKTTTLTASAKLAAKDLPASDCQATFGSSGIKCASVTSGGFTQVSRAVRVTVK